MFQTNYAQYYDLFNSDKPYKKEIRFVYKWAENPKTILDIGCGTANYWKYYPKETKLAGVEMSKHMVEVSPHYKNIIQLDISKHHIIVGKYDCVTALFDVINYIPNQNWWKNLPIKKGGYFIFDVWDSKKVDADGFHESFRLKNGVSRTIKRIGGTDKIVDLEVEIVDGEFEHKEEHKMYLYSHDDIVKSCGKEFDIVEVKETENWQRWYKLRRK